jgi:hypothetical protein
MLALSQCLQLPVIVQASRELRYVSLVPAHFHHDIKARLQSIQKMALWSSYAQNIQCVRRFSRSNHVVDGEIHYVRSK